MSSRNGSGAIGRTSHRFHTVLAVVLSAGVGLALSGCDQQRQALADLIAPPGPGQTAARIDEAVQQNKGRAGIEIGVAYLNSHPDPDGLVHHALAAAYLSTGDVAQAAGQMALSIASGAAAPKADQPAAAAAAQDGPLQPAVVAGDAAVIQSPNGMVVKAGDAVVSPSK